MVEQNNDLLMKNHESWPTGYELFYDVNEAYSYHAMSGKGRDPNCGCGHRCGHGHGRGRGCDNGQMKKENIKIPMT